MINLLTDKIEQILEKHNVIVTNQPQLQEELVKLFIDSQLTPKTPKNNKKNTIPRDFKTYMKKEGFLEKDIEKIYTSITSWIVTAEGTKWLCSLLGLVREILSSDMAIEYLQKNGSKISLKPLNTIIYYRDKPAVQKAKS